MQNRTQLFSKTALLLAATMFAFAQVACDVEILDNVNNNDFEARSSFSHSIEIQQQMRLVIDAKNGPIKVVGSPGAATVEITGARIVTSDSPADAEEYLEKLKVNLQSRDNEIYVETEQPRLGRGRNFTVEYNVVVPADWDVFLDDDNGEITVENTSGALDVELTNGNVFFTGNSGTAYVEIVNGQFEGRHALQKDGTFKVSVTNGQIDLKIPESTNADLNASTRNGRVSVTGLVVENAVSDQKSFEGTLGEGAGQIELKTTNGNVNVEAYQ